MEIFGKVYRESEWNKLYIKMLGAVAATSMFEKKTLYGVFEDYSLSEPGIVVSISIDNVPRSKAQYIHAVMSRPGTGRHLNHDEIGRMLYAIGNRGNPYYKKEYAVDTPVTHFYWPYPFDDQNSHYYLKEQLGLEEYI